MRANLRERKKTQVRSDLVDAAFRLIQDRGFDHVTVAEIAAEAGVSSATFFRYFASKEDVAFGEAPYRLATAQGRVATSLASLGPRRAVREALVALAEDLEADPEFVRRLGVVFGHEALRARLDQTLGRWVDELEVDLAEAMPSAAERLTFVGSAMAVLRAGLVLRARVGGTLADHVREGFRLLG